MTAEFVDFGFKGVSRVGLTVTKGNIIDSVGQKLAKGGTNVGKGFGLIVIKSRTNRGKKVGLTVTNGYIDCTKGLN